VRSRKENSGKLVAKEIRTPNNVYILGEINEEIFFMGKIDESWLWTKIMGHMNFDNLVKISTNQEVSVIQLFST